MHDTAQGLIFIWVVSHVEVKSSAQ